jgi:uncharacterized protein
MTDAAVRQMIEPQTGVAFVMSKGSTLTVIDVQGQQVSDLTAFGLDQREWLSSGRSIDYNNTITITTDHVLYSNRSNKMFTIVEDSVAVHDFLYAPCSPEMFRVLYGYGPDHPSCFRNLVDNLKAFGIEDDQVPTTFNIFMNVEVMTTGELKIHPPASKPGDYIKLLQSGATRAGGRRQHRRRGPGVWCGGSVRRCRGHHSPEAYQGCRGVLRGALDPRDVDRSRR